MNTKEHIDIAASPKGQKAIESLNLLLEDVDSKIAGLTATRHSLEAAIASIQSPASSHGVIPTASAPAGTVIGSHKAPAKKAAQKGTTARRMHRGEISGRSGDHSSTGGTVMDFVYKYVEKHGRSLPSEVGLALKKQRVPLRSSDHRSSARSALKQLAKKGMLKHLPEGGYVIAGA